MTGLLIELPAQSTLTESAADRRYAGARGKDREPTQPRQPRPTSTVSTEISTLYPQSERRGMVTVPSLMRTWSSANRKSTRKVPLFRVESVAPELGGMPIWPPNNCRELSPSSMATARSPRGITDELWYRTFTRASLAQQAADSDEADEPQPAYGIPRHTAGAHPCSYVRSHFAAASASPTMWPVLGSTRSV
jgi:hypothetical protein